MMVRAARHIGPLSGCKMHERVWKDQEGGREEYGRSPMGFNVMDGRSEAVRVADCIRVGGCAMF
jgi:hypothetical protein